jgi:DNA repair exonuclease SbcCD ATPase subunit
MLTHIKTNIEQRRGRYQQLLIEKEAILAKIKKLEMEKTTIEKARAIINTVAQQTQIQVEKYLSDLCTSALEAIFEEPYKTHVEFVQRRNRTECDIYFTKKDNRISPLDASGGGVINVASFALKVGTLMLSTNRKILFTDEPFNFLHSSVYHNRVAELLETLSNQTKLQILMVTGEEESESIISKANRVYRVKMNKGVSTVELVK